MRGRAQQAGDKGEMIDEKAEFHLVAGPVRGTVKRKAEKQHVGRREQRHIGEAEAGQEAEHQANLEDGGEPGQRQWKRKARRGDVSGGGADIEQLERRRHGEDAGENEPRHKDRDISPSHGRS